MDVTRFMNSKFYVSRPGGVNSSGDPVDYGPPELVWGAMSAALWRIRGFQSDEIDEETEIATLQKIEQYDRIWTPGQDVLEDQPKLAQHTHPVTNMYGDIVYYVTRL